jgi:plastocyanin
MKPALATLPLLLLCCCAFGQVSVTATVSFAHAAGKARTDPDNVAVWLTPLQPTLAPASAAAPIHPRLVQKNKTFEPHILIIPVGTEVEFPNHDPFFHNVFSLFEGKRFDLGLYEAGTTRNVLFDKPGVSYIFCNIHAEMSAVVIALNTPYYAVSDRKGQITVANVPAGKYLLHVWYEAASPETLNSLIREITVGPQPTALGTLHLPSPGTVTTHTNLYGHDYPPPTPDQPVYGKP